MRRALAAAAMLWVGACASSPIARDQLHEPGALLFNGYTNPNANCFSCHGGDGRGGARGGPDLRQAVPRLDDAHLREVILNGTGIMPPFKDKLSDAEVGELVNWMRATFGTPRG